MQHGLRWPGILMLASTLFFVGSSLAKSPAQGPDRIRAEPREVSPRGALSDVERQHVDVFKAVSPTVVHINTTAHARRPFSTRVTEVLTGSGTGFVWDQNGHIVTNFHVIAEGSGVSVTLSDHSVWPAELVGYFADRDLAVLRIDTGRKKLPAIALGTSKDLVVGQQVYAIGNPFGLDQTMTAGIVSALNREIPSSAERTIRGVIQTDAAINPGNSGGPLLDSAGRLIGVNTAIYSPSGASVGIGFAIPVDEVNRIVPKLINDGRFIRPVIGIVAAPPGFLESLGLADGLAVIGLDRDGPAKHAGIKPFRRNKSGRIVVGDVIVGIDETKIHSLDDLHAELEKHIAGKQLVLKIRRAGHMIKIVVILAQGS